jgi:hypothetical protein
MQDPHYLRLCHPHHHAFGHRHGRRKPLGLSDQASLPQEFVRPQDGDHRFLPRLGEHAHFDVALPDVEDRVRIVALGEDDCFLGMRGNDATTGGRFQELHRIEKGTHRRFAPGYSVHGFRRR